MITRGQLLASGYKPFKQKNIKEYTDNFYQKCFRDESGKRYFITIVEYDNRELIRGGHNCEEFAYEPDAQFEALGNTFNVQMLSPESVEVMEKFFFDIWLNMSCDYYEVF